MKWIYVNTCAGMRYGQRDYEQKGKGSKETFFPVFHILKLETKY